MASAHLARRYVERPAEVETPFSIMRFRLIYDGVLPSLRARKSWAPIKWDIRQQISAQLSELYDIHPTIGMRQRVIMAGGLGIPGSFDLKDETGTYLMGAYDVVRDPIMIG